MRTLPPALLLVLPSLLVTVADASAQQHRIAFAEAPGLIRMNGQEVEMTVSIPVVAGTDVTRRVPLPHTRWSCGAYEQLTRGTRVIALNCEYTGAANVQAEILSFDCEETFGSVTDASPYGAVYRLRVGCR